MVHAVSTSLHTTFEAEQTIHLYTNLNSLLLILEMEQSNINKVEKNKNLHLPKEINFSRFLREGMMYLGMINDFKNWIMPNTEKSRILHKTLNLFARIKFQYNRMKRMRSLLYMGAINYAIREDIFIVFDDVIEEQLESRIRAENGNVYEIDEYEIIPFYDWQSFLRIRNKYMNLIFPLIDKINYTIMLRFLTLCTLLQKYCTTTTQFLCNNKKNLKLNKLYRKQKLRFCCKYHCLKKLIICCHQSLFSNQIK